MAARSKEWVWVDLLLGLGVRIPPGCLSVVSVVYCQIEVSATS